MSAPRGDHAIPAAPALCSGLLCQRVAHYLGAQPDAVLAHPRDGLRNGDGMAVIPSFDQHADGTRERQSREVRHAPTHTLVDTDERDLKIQRALDDRCLAAVQAIAQVGGITADSPRRSSQSAPSNAATPGGSLPLPIAWISSTLPPEILLPGERHGRAVSAWGSAKRTRRLRMRRRARAPDRGR
jgi:hypothetical protein